MKRLSTKDWQRHQRVLRYSLRRQERHKRLKNGKSRKNGKPVKRISVKPPRIFSFSKNYSETVCCLQDLKKHTLAPELSNRIYHINIDLAEIQELSVAAALVLAAEIDRWRLIKSIKLKPERLDSWHPDVKRTLSALRFFELLGLKNPDECGSEISENERIVLPFISSVGIGREESARLEDSLREVARQFDQEPSIYEALVEATYNAVKHAYPSDHKWIYRPLEDKWWATASWDAVKSEVKFLVFDQGVGIPETLPKWEFWEDVRSFFGPLAPKLAKEHSSMIVAALAVSRTSQSSASGNGQGLSDVVRPIQFLKGSRVRILSGKGQILYKSKRDIEKIENTHHVGGTLIEWTIPVQPVGQNS